MNALILVRLSYVCLVASVLLGGCAGSQTDADPSGDDIDIDVADPEINAGGVTEIRIMVEQPVNAAPPPPGECAWAGTWTLDFETGLYTGRGCTRGGFSDPEDRILSREPYKRRAARGLRKRRSRPAAPSAGDELPIRYSARHARRRQARSNHPLRRRNDVVQLDGDPPRRLRYRRLRHGPFRGIDPSRLGAV